MLRPVLASLAVVAAATAGALLPVTPGETPTRPASHEEPAEPSRPVKPLAGKVVVIDPGHQLGNAHFPTEVNALVPAGGLDKPCNTTGTATDDGVPEATITWQVAQQLRKRLRNLGARVVMTRTSNRADRWGPCVDVRGRMGNGIPADLKISIHADGSYSGGRGFHVIAPTDTAPTRDIFRPSRRLATKVKQGLLKGGVPVADYIAGGDGLDFRNDLGTLNLSRMPVVMVEMGNLRSDEDARRLTTRRGRTAYVDGMVRGVRSFLTPSRRELTR